MVDPFIWSSNFLVYYRCNVDINDAEILTMVGNLCPYLIKLLVEFRKNG